MHDDISRRAVITAAHVQTPAGPPAGWDIPGSVVYIDDPDEAFQQQLAAANYRAQQQLLNTREWLDDSELAELAASEVAQFSPTFWLTVRRCLLILAIAFAILWHFTGAHHMQGPTNTPPAPAAAPESKGEPHGATLKAAINRFATAVIAVATHPDTGMFFFDAPDLSINEKLGELKIRALVDTLCAAGIIERHRFENRLEELVAQAADKLEQGAKRLAFTARVTPGPNNGSGH